MSDFLEADKGILRSRAHWTHRGSERPSFARTTRAGEESVWDYPRPPRLAPDSRRIEVRLGTLQIAQTTAAIRVLETASAPTFYLPPIDVRTELLSESGGRSTCEWKGVAHDLNLTDGTPSVGWCYPRVFPEFAEIAGWISFYPSRVECFIDDERVRPQPGGFYGGWITNEIVGPIKGEPGYDGL